MPSNESLFYIPIVLLGLAMGSFLNAWMWRTRVGTSVLRGWSACVRCHHRLAWLDNIPVLSFCFLRGRCRYCSKQISWQYPLIEIWTACAFVFAAFYHNVALGGISELLIRDWIILLLLTFIFVYDLRYKEIWDHVTTVPAVLLFIFFGVFGWLSWVSMITGAAIAAGFFALQYVLSKGTWIGGGDIRMGLLMGVILGTKAVLVALFLAYGIGAIVGIILLITKKKQKKSELPFGTFLAIGTLIALFFGETLLTWYGQHI